MDLELQLHAALDLELLTLREVLDGGVRQLPATFEVHGPELRAPREVLGGRVRQGLAAFKVHGVW